MERYIAIAYKTSDGYSIVFPDFPGCTSAARSFTEIVHQAAEALMDHVDLMKEGGDTIPAPRSLEEVYAVDAEFKDGIPVCVPLLPVGGKAKPVNVTVDERLLSVIDAAAKQRHMNRSEFLCEAARRFIVDSAV